MKYLKFIILIVVIVFGILLYKYVIKKNVKSASHLTYNCHRETKNLKIFSYDKTTFETKEYDSSYGTYSVLETVYMKFENNNLTNSERTVVYTFTNLNGFNTQYINEDGDTTLYENSHLLTKTLRDNLRLFKYPDNPSKESVTDYINKYIAAEYACEELKED